MQKNKNLIFYYNEYDYFEVQGLDLEDDCLHDQIIVVRFCINNKKYDLYHVRFFDFVQDTIDIFESLLQHTLLFSGKNLGKIHMQDIYDIFYENKDVNLSVGKYCWWDSVGDENPLYSVWLYETNDEYYIFEINQRPLIDFESEEDDVVAENDKNRYKKYINDFRILERVVVMQDRVEKILASFQKIFKKLQQEFM